MHKLGYDPGALLQRAQQQQATYDMDCVGDEANGIRGVMAYAEARGIPEVAPEEADHLAEEEQSCFPEIDLSQDTEQAANEVREVLMSKVEEARALGCGEEFENGLKSLLIEYADVFRLRLGRDPPVDMPPLKVTLKPDARPVRCKARRYPEAHRVFMRKHIAELEAAGLCYRNSHSKWCSPPLIVKKPGVNKFRMTVDVRPVNAQTQRILWPMPMLEVILDNLNGSEVYFLLDFFKGYWQFLLALDCQEFFSFLTDMGVFTPTRVLMGGSDSVAYCQSTVEETFADLLYRGLLIWLDDLLGYHKTAEGLLKLLRGALAICKLKRLKLNPTKCSFFLREALWCGRVVSGAGVKHDPARIETLRALPPPKTAQELQQFVCALNWMRMSVPGYNKIVQPLVDLMEQAYIKADGRTKRKVARVQLTDVGWTQLHNRALQQCKEALLQAVTLAHPDMSKRLCVFTDASELHWGAAITQIPPDHSTRDLAEQHHQPLMFLSGTFSGSAKKWAIVEKEAYAIIETCKRADYLLHRPGGFDLFTDHRNLRYIFDPASVIAAVPKYTADKLQRWALLLMAYEYTIHDIAGDANVWADLLSRWGSPLHAVCAIKQISMVQSPSLSDDFVWPTAAEIIQAQKRSLIPEKPQLECGTDGLSRLQSGQIWIPANEGSLQMRLCIIGHFGAAGHRGKKSTLEAIQSRYFWDDLEEDVGFFISRCLHCASVNGGPPVPRPLGEALHAEKPNELIHWDFLFMGEADTGEMYILVVKDDATKFVWLFPCAEATADTTFDCLLQWFAVFGISHAWVSDQGTHFKNDVIKNLQHALGAHHHFTTARCPWANGTVEVVMRDALRCFRALLSEWRLPQKAWPRIAKVVQLVLNQSVALSLGGLAPVTAMTGLPAMSPLDAISVPAPVETTTLEKVQTNRKLHVQALQKSLANMHKEMNFRSSSARVRGRTSHLTKTNAAMAQFDIGDYVLYADVWAHTRTKLSVKWCGPAQIVGTTSNWIFSVKNLITGETREAHASRLKFYADDSLQVNEEFLRHVAHNSEGHVVK